MQLRNVDFVLSYSIEDVQSTWAWIKFLNPTFFNPRTAGVTDRQTDRQTDKQMDRQTDIHERALGLLVEKN